MSNMFFASTEKRSFSLQDLDQRCNRDWKQGGNVTFLATSMSCCGVWLARCHQLVDGLMLAAALMTSMCSLWWEHEISGQAMSTSMHRALAEGGWSNLGFGG
jgi:hypothetical protein